MVSFSHVLISTRRDVTHESMSDESDIYFDITLQPLVHKNDRFVDVLWVCGCISCQFPHLHKMKVWLVIPKHAETDALHSLFPSPKHMCRC